MRWFMLMTEARHVTDHHRHCHVMYVVGRSFCALCENRACFYKTGIARIKFNPIDGVLMNGFRKRACTVNKSPGI